VACARHPAYRPEQRIVRNSATAEDLVHDSFVTLIGRELDPSPRDQVADLTRIAQNLALDHRRREARMASLEETATFDLADASPSPETIVADRDALLQTLKILAAMPERTRCAFQMHSLGEKKLAQIAAELSISTAHAGGW
jgi:RNA polymerase sigma-70 factor (ECF subfamily)